MCFRLSAVSSRNERAWYQFVLLLIAACLAYLWLIYLGTLASQPHWRRLIHRSDRCNLSLFQLGLRLLDFWLGDDAPLRVAFLPQATHAQVVVFRSVR